MKKKEIIFLCSFADLRSYVTHNKLFIKKISDEFQHVYFVNFDNLVEYKKKRNYNRSEEHTSELQSQ